MPFPEATALDVVALRAVESARPEGSLWTDADRAWASRAAAEVVGATARPEDFLAVRARLGLERVAARAAPIRRAVAALRWRPWLGWTVVLFATVAGVAVDAVGGGQRINLLAPPFFGLLVWNLAVYAALVAGLIVRYGDAGPPGLLRRALLRVATGHPRGGRGDTSAIVARLVDDWGRVALPLYSVRAARILHVAAAAFGAALVAGLYARGIAFEYRASWESTFLDVTSVQRLLAAALAPGAALSGIAVPSVADLEALRAPASGNAARWLHLIAATVLLIVVGPRLVLALGAGAVEHFRRARVPIPFDEPYFARLLRGFHGGPARVRVLPYSYTPDPAAAAALEQLVRTVFGSAATLSLLPIVPYGAESAPGPSALDALAARDDAGATHVALFSATATPEAATHGAFLEVLRTRLPPTATLVALVDDGPWRKRWGDDPDRRAARAAAWQALAGETGTGCAVLTLEAADHDAAVAAVEAVLDRDAR